MLLFLRAGYGMGDIIFNREIWWSFEKIDEGMIHSLINGNPHEIIVVNDVFFVFCIGWFLLKNDNIGLFPRLF